MAVHDRCDKQNIWPQIYATITASLATGSGGIVMGWMSPAATHLLHPDSGYHLDYEEIAWMASTMNLAMGAGAVYTVLIVDTIGRKFTLLTSFIFYAACWFFAIFGNEFVELMLSRFFGGVGVGVSLCCCTYYIAEVSENSRRGSLSVIPTLFITLGILYASVIGARFSLTVLNWLSLIIPVLFVSTFIWAPETPYFYIKKERNNEALKSLKWLRGEKDDELVKNEMKSIAEFVNKNSKLGFVDTLKAMTSRNNARALALALVTYFGQQCCGMFAIVAYTEKIFRDVDSPLEPADAVAVLAAVTSSFTLFSSLTVDRGGRKLLLIVSCAGTCICNIIIGTYLLLSQRGIIDSSFSWMGMVGMFGFKMSLASGLNAVPLVLIGEIFPSSTRSWCICLITVYSALLASSVTKLFQIIDSTLGGYAAFYLFAICSILTIIYISIFMVETKKKSFNDIQASLNSTE